MISNVRLRNFQRHELVEFEPGSTVTTIVGPSDRGKSACLRSLRWLCLNQPRGDEFIRARKLKGAVVRSKRTSVEVVVDGRRVERARGEGVNSYAVDGKVLKAFGVEPPAEVASILRVGPENFAQQHDPAFWLGKGAAELSRDLNRIVDLGVIDRTLGELGKVLRRTRSDEAATDQRLSAARAEVASLTKAERADVTLRALEALEADHGRLAKASAGLVAGLRRAQGVDSRVRRIRAFLRASERVVALGEGCARSEAKAASLRRLLAAGKGLARASRPIPRIVGVSAAADALGEVSARLAEVRSALDAFGKLKDLASSLTAARTGAERELREAMGDECPLCGQEVKA